MPGSPAQPYYYGPDQIGSVRRVFASTSSAPAYSYDPYGNALQGTAPLTDFNYAGMFYNTDSGLYLTQYRAYDPVSGRWLSRDPIGESGDTAANLYRYASNSPVVFNDPSGLCVGDILNCIANAPNIGGIVSALVGGASAIAAGAPILPYSLFGPAISGGGPSGATSVISALARGFIGSGIGGGLVNENSGPLLTSLSKLTGTASVAGIAGRLLSGVSVGVGVGLEAYSAYQIYKAYLACSQ